MEEWKPVEGSHGMIVVSSNGRIGSLLRGNLTILKTQSDAKGYQRVRVTINRVKRTYKVHREVAKAFIDNPSGLPQVNHIDGNKNNNCASNLEWVTNADNAIHAIKTGLWESVIEGALMEDERRKKPIKAFKIDSPDEVLYFDSISEAERVFNSRHITDVLKGKRQTCKGYAFQYLRKEVV